MDDLEKKIKEVDKNKEVKKKFGTRLCKKYVNIKFARVNVDNNQNIAMRFGIQSIPTFVMFKDGKSIDKMVGAVGEPGIHMICKKYSLDQ